MNEYYKNPYLELLGIKMKENKLLAIQISNMLNIFFWELVHSLSD